MSGIVGILHLDGSPINPRLLQQLTDSLEFRGPDGKQVWTAGHVGFGHTLLKTTRDPGRQPFTLADGSCVVADARVDARAALIEKLQAHGHENLPGANTTDAELILRAYQVRGQECVEHLLGDFAFAIWDPAQQRLFCARDHMGIKPFYYGHIGSIVVFSNTLSCIRRHPAVSGKLNDLAVADFLLFDAIHDPAASAFADIQRLPPAHVLTSQRGHISLRSYWTLSAATPIHYRRDAEYVEHFRDLLDASVADRLRTDSAGVLMSGGLDSPTVAASAQRVFSSRGSVPGLRAYTEAFDLLIPHEERRYATLVADALKIPIQLRAGDGARIFEFADRPSPEPMHFAWPDRTPLQLREVVANSSMVLTGFGADPMLSSLLSAHFRQLLRTKQFSSVLIDAARYLATEGRFSRLYIRKRLRRWFPPKTEMSWYPEWLNPDLEKRLGLRERWQILSASSAPKYAHRPVAHEQTAANFWPLLFEAYDPGVTQIPVEVSHPFFDLRLMHFLLALPTVPWCCDKELLREAARGVLPDTVRLRRKSPLSADPLGALLQQPESAWVDRFEPLAELEQYVLRNRIPAVFGKLDPWTVWIHLRPLSLNFWLKTTFPSLDRTGVSQKILR